MAGVVVDPPSTEVLPVVLVLPGVVVMTETEGWEDVPPNAQNAVTMTAATMITLMAMATERFVSLAWHAG